MILSRRSQRVRRGATAIVMVVVMLLVAVIVIGATLTGARDQDLTVRRVETVQSFYAAESGMNMAIREIINNADEDGDGGVGSISDDDNDANNPTFGAATVLVTTEPSGDDTLLTSVGTRGAATRRIQARLTGSVSSSPGLYAEYFIMGGSLSQLSDVNWAAAPDYTETVSQLNFPSTGGAWWSGGPTDRFGAQYTGKVTVATAGTWTFYTNSDDGSKLWVNGTEVVDNDGLHGMLERSGTISLTEGTHDFVVQLFENGGGVGLIVSWQGPGGSPSKEVIPSSAFTH